MTPSASDTGFGALDGAEGVRRRVDRLTWELEGIEKAISTEGAQLADVEEYLSVSDGVREALEQLNTQLFRQLLDLLEQKLTLALQEILEQPIQFRADSDFKRGAASAGNAHDGFGGRCADASHCQGAIGRTSRQRRGNRAGERGKCQSGHEPE